MSDTKLFLGIEVGDTSLKVALLEPTEKRVIKTAVLQTEVRPIDDIFTFETVLQAWLDENQLENIDSISVTVPAFQSIIRQVFVPAEAVPNIAEYLQWYMGQISNADKDAYVLDYRELGGDASLGKTVLLIAVRREWVDALRKGFRSKNLIPKAMEVDVLSVMNLMDVGGLIDGMECVIKANYTGVTMFWITKDKLHALRCVSTLSLVNAESMEAACSQLADDILEQMALAHEQNAVPEVKQVHLCGEMAMDPTFVQILREKVNGECQLTLMDSFAGLRLPVDEADSTAVLCCTGAIGAALGVMEGV